MSPENGNDDEESTPPTPARKIGHDGNKDMLRILGNYVIESRHHTSKLEGLYGDLVALTYPSPKSWAEKLLAEFERHHTSDEGNLQALRQIVQSP